MTSILPSPTDNRSISEIFETTVSTKLNLCTLPKYEEKFNKQHKETLIKNKPNKIQNNIQDVPYTSTSTKFSKRDQYSESSSDHQYIVKLVVTFHKINKKSTILQLQTINRSNIEIDATTVSNNITISNLLENTKVNHINSRKKI